MYRREFAIVLIILAAFVFACGCTGTGTTTTADENVIGVLLPLTGDYTESGQAVRAAVEVAAEDVNNYFTQIGSTFQVRLVVEDTATDPAVALDKLKQLEKEGIRIVIGPGSSAELEAIRSYADEHGILVVSTMSTAPSLAIEGDNVFRFVPPDTFQADAMAYCLEEDGIAAVVPVWRGDVWGDELRNLTKGAFEEAGGAFFDGVMYTPGTEDYGNLVSDLDIQVGRAIDTHGAGKVGVYAVTFSEIVPIMEAASGTGNLSQVRWYGCDANVLLDTLTAPGDAARFAAQTDFTGPAIGNANRDPRSEAVYQKIQDRLGHKPDGYGMASYDAVWVVALTGIQTSSTDVADLKVALTETASWYQGSQGTAVELDSAGDPSTAHYVFWSLGRDGDAYGWEQVYTYNIWGPGTLPEFEPVGS